MTSPLEDKPEILRKIGLFTVLFNAIDLRLGIEPYFMINQSDLQNRPLLDFISSQDFSKKLEILKIRLGENLYLRLKEINRFRTFIAHSSYGMDQLGNISLSKIKRNSGGYDTMKLSEEMLDKNINSEREILTEFGQKAYDKAVSMKNS